MRFRLATELCCDRGTYVPLYTRGTFNNQVVLFSSLLYILSEGIGCI